MRHSAWNVDPVRILTRRELAAVLGDLTQRGARSQDARLNRTILRLACCCGLRVSEIAGLALGDVHIEGGRPHLHVRPQIAKGGRRRRVPLWWDKGTLDDLAAWKRERVVHGARDEDHFVCCLRPGRFGSSLIRHTIRERFRTACKVLGLERLRGLTIHHGRHTFVSHALAGGRT
jgi:integrase